MTGNGDRPPVDLDPNRVIYHLNQRILLLTQELAMKDAYIDRLHEALRDVAEPAPGS